jgi:hypothetical protein
VKITTESGGPITGRLIASSTKTLTLIPDETSGERTFDIEDVTRIRARAKTRGCRNALVPRRSLDTQIFSDQNVDTG